MVAQDKMMFRSHPWHGLDLGAHAPQSVNCYIEMVPSDTVKYELDKNTGLLKVDRPQKYSSLCPTLYGLLPQTFAADRVAQYCMEKGHLKSIVGDGDPLDVCVLTEKVIPRGDIILSAVPIGGFRLIDGNEADDKIIAVLMGDFIFGKYTDISSCQKGLIERLRHYFLTYKDTPERNNSKVQIIQIYGAKEAHEVINLGREDYKEKFGKATSR
jgi:inorganic pyrophosphatase